MTKCEGCNLENLNCSIKRHNQINNCPCTECLFKVICKDWDDTCQAYTSLLSVIHQCKDDISRYDNG